MVARYHIHLNAYLPTGPLTGDGQRTFELHEGPKELDYAGPPSTAWSPLNAEAVEAMAKRYDALIAAQEQAITMCDPKSRALPTHVMRLNQLKAKRKGLRVEMSAGLEAELAAPLQAQAKPGRPSDSPARR